MIFFLIPWENLKPLEKYHPSPSKKSQSTRKTSFIIKVSTTRKASTIMKKPQPLHMKTKYP